MQRLKNCAGFGLWFVGLAYIAIRGVGLVAGCGGEGASAACGLVQLQSLPPAFDLFGLLAAIAVMIQLLLIALRHRRGIDGDTPRTATGNVTAFLRHRKPPSTVMRVKSRDHFGLRGTRR
jgi:hypothetical protein